MSGSNIYYLTYGWRLDNAHKYKKGRNLLKTVPKWEDVTVTIATTKQVVMLMYLYICLRVYESCCFSQNLGLVMISAWTCTALKLLTMPTLHF